MATLPSPIALFHSHLCWQVQSVNVLMTHSCWLVNWSWLCSCPYFSWLCITLSLSLYRLSIHPPDCLSKKYPWWLSPFLASLTLPVTSRLQPTIHPNVAMSWGLNDDLFDYGGSLRSLLPQIRGMIWNWFIFTKWIDYGISTTNRKPIGGIWGNC